MAGGHGTRLRPLTFTGNKHMLPIANKPMILYGFEHLIEAGIKEIGVILGPIKEGVMELLGDGSEYGVKITYINQPEPKGLAHAVMISENFLKGEPFVMYLGDNLLKQGAKPLMNAFENGKGDCAIGVAKVREPSRYGVVVFSEDGKIRRLVEKPKQFVSDWALIGVYVFNDKIFEAVKKIKPSWRNELEITDAIQVLIDSGTKVDVQFVQGWWKDTGRPEDLLEANQLVLHDLETSYEGEIEEGVIITGNVRIGRDTIVHTNSKIRGPTIIGNGCEIGSNTYIGPYTCVGNHVTIIESEIENSIVMDNAYITCKKRIVDSIIGRNVKIEDNANYIPKGHQFFLGDMSYLSI